MFFYLVYVAIGLVSVIIGLAKLANPKNRHNFHSLIISLLLILWPFILVLVMIGHELFVNAFGQKVISSSFPGKYVYNYCDICAFPRNRFAFEIDSGLNVTLIDTANLKFRLPNAGKIIYSTTNNPFVAIEYNGSTYGGYIERRMHSFDISFYCDRDPDEGYCFSMTKSLQ